MTKIKLTIIIPHYNSSDLLEKLLLTIPKDRNIEVIVIDDKSEDGHINYIQNIKESKKYINFIFLKNKTTKKGAGTARNIGLKKANGEWILFADADDYFTENFYESISKYFESENEVVFFKATSIYIDTGEIADRHINIVNTLDKFINDTNKKNELNLRYNLPGPICKLIKKEFIERQNIEFNEVLVAEDVMFSTKVGFYMEKFTISERVLYIITKNHGSVTTNVSEKIFDIRFKTIIEYYTYLRKRLSKSDFDLVDLSGYIRIFILESMRYGIFKFFKTLIIIQRNDMKFFHYKLLDPLHLVTKTIQYRKNIKKNEKYIVKENQT